jgi:hypothetical protein
MIVATTGASADTYAPDGRDGDIHTVLWPVHNGLLRYCGFDVIEPFIAYMPGRVGPEVRQRYLDDYRARLFDIVHARRLYFRRGPNERLRPGVIARSGVQRKVWPSRRFSRRLTRGAAGRFDWAGRGGGLCTVRLADAGARVIKIERTEGETARHYDSSVEGMSAYFVWLNRGKESAALDLKGKEDLALLHPYREGGHFRPESRLWRNRSSRAFQSG